MVRSTCTCTCIIYSSCYEPLVADARERKQAKYLDLLEAGRGGGFKTELITVDVGSGGMLCATT